MYSTAKLPLGLMIGGEISSDVSYPVIRNLYFREDRADAGELLLREAMKCSGENERVYAFFHYFGMSCFARHGKLFEANTHIDTLLRQSGFEVEHENVYYSTLLSGDENTDAVIAPGDLTEGAQQCVDFSIDGTQVGGCQVHYVNDTTAYLRWIYVNGDMVGKGVGTRCMKALRRFLYERGVRRFDTDTAVRNLVAQHYYEKNGFTRQGITRSYYTKEVN